MPKGLAETTEDELCPAYNLVQLGRGVRGKYYRQAKAGTNLVLIEPDLAQAFPDQESVNRALRLLVSTASATTRASRRPSGPSGGIFWDSAAGDCGAPSEEDAEHTRQPAPVRMLRDSL